MATKTVKTTTTTQAPKAAPNPYADLKLPGNQTRTAMDKLVAAAIQILDGNATMKATLADPANASFTYASLWGTCELIRMDRLGVKQHTGLEGAQLGKFVAEMRHAEGLGAEYATKLGCANGKGLSWGVISCLTNLPESKVRKAYTDFTNTFAQGQRIGHGGRFMDNTVNHYRGERVAEGSGVDRKVFGTRLERGTDAEVLATTAIPTAPVLGKSSSRKRTTKASPKASA